MNKLILLLGVYIKNELGVNRALHTRDRSLRRNAILIAIAMFVAVVSVMGMVFTYAYFVTNVLGKIGAAEFLPILLLTLASVSTLFTTIYKATSVLFTGRDYDLLMALPISAQVFVASRVMILFFMNLTISLLIVLPAVAAYSVAARPEVWFYARFVMILPFAPMLPIIAATLLSFLISWLASRFRRTNALVIILSLLLIVGVTALQFVMGRYYQFALTTIPKMLSGFLERFYPPAAMLRRGISEGDVFQLFAFIALSLAAFALYVALVSHLVSPIRGAMTTSHARGKFKMRRMAQRSPLAALFAKELRRYLSSAIYVMNTIVGPLMSVGMAAVMLLYGAGTLETILEIPGLSSWVGALAPLMLSVFAAMLSASCSCISMEGKSLWLLKSLPVNAGTIFMAKLMVSVSVQMIGVLVGGALMAVALRATAAQTALIFLTPTVYSLFSSLTGLVANLRFPKFDWTNETYAIKQGMAVIVTMLAGVLACALPITLIVLAPGINPMAATLCATVIIAAACGGLIFLLRGWGARTLARL